MQFLWTDWRLQYEIKELLAHTKFYYSGGLNRHFNVREPQARDDDSLLVIVYDSLASITCSNAPTSSKGFSRTLSLRISEGGL